MAGTGEPVAGAKVILEWEGSGSGWSRWKRIEVVTDNAGRYRACGVPAGVEIDVRATTQQAESPVQRLEAPPSDVVFLDFWFGWPTAGNLSSLHRLGTITRLHSSPEPEGALF